ncbi:MAG: 50S ribosomal protein L22 [Candidatus Vogelbacteria bacterium RIFOXYD2_FULL_44_9]|uniref:Large ribosomal subunit protein uL22 n=1 Tax=Candidatus Vogelbacteria bacterium RIFOXYD2_FULL_44_9 TaxID=1802441 RepID=A0A1G2QKK2_9BACT|nr:MAG: 50S ribosomal protein L22 [Candidatus Vogelbacteria bacterium RIFOXYD2_FULL_44_9]
MKAVLTNYRQAPRKVRLAADLLRGKMVTVAEMELNALSKKASPILMKLLASAVANAINNDKADKSKLFIKEITVDKGMVLKRFFPGAHGKAYPINRKNSHVKIVLGIKEVSVAKVKKVTKKVAKKVKN